MLLNHFPEFYARNYPDSPAVTLDGESTNFRALDLLANRLANGLLDLGLEPGQRVAILGENSLEHLALVLACAKIRAVTVPLNYRLAASELAYILKDSDARALFVPDAAPDVTLAQLRPALPEGLTLFIAGDAGDESLDAWLAAQPEHAPARRPDPEDPLLQLYTSGTTGHPKGVLIPHRAIIALATMNSTMMRSRPQLGNAGLVCAPFFHIGGMGTALLGLYAGNNVIVHRSFDPEAVVRDIERFPINNVFLVPAMIMAILALPDIESRDFSNLVQVCYGASPISESVLRRAMEVFGVEFIQVYGMTETTGSVVALGTEDHRRALAGKPELLRSCGRPNVGADIKVVDPAGNPLPPGETGEVWVWSDTNMLGYHNAPEATAESLTDGWVHTGDAGYLDEDGYLYLKDRLKDMVVSGGENIYPVEVENAIADHPAVADVAVIGVPDQKFGEALRAFVVPRPGAALSLEEMIDFCRARIAGYKIPRQLEVVDALPRNPSGKILKKELRKPFWDGADRSIG